MRLALVILHADPARGGAERYTFDLAATLAKRGHQVSLLASSFAQVPTGVTPVQLQARGITRAGRYRRFLRSLDEELDRPMNSSDRSKAPLLAEAADPVRRFDVVHAMLPVRRCDFYLPHAGVAAEAAVGSVRHRLNRRRVLFASVEKQLLEGSWPPIVLCLSDVIGRVVEKWYPNLPAERRFKLFNGVDTVKFRPAVDEAERAALRARFGLPADKPLALMIAQDFARKGLGPTIEALKLTSQDLHLAVAGRDDPAPYQALALRENVSDRIHWIGPTDDPASLYRTADVFVLPTRHDPCSLVVLEALASGLPVITTTKNGAAEIMQQGVHGVVLAHSATGFIAAGFESVSDAQVLSEMGNMCKKLRASLSWEAHADRLIAAYVTAGLAWRPKEQASV